uniref:Uncharacterized protein n=1 Tax=Anopheles epiroticus TaxID=199890 RepID=A0A182P158_9DIPT
MDLRGDDLSDRGAVYFSDRDRSNHFGDWSNGLDDLVSLQGFTADDGVESVVLIGGVVNHTAVTVGVDQGVLSLNVISVALFLLALDVSGVVIMNGVLELVLGRGFWVLDVLYSLDQSWLDSLDKSGLDSLNNGWLVILLVLWLVMVRIVVLSAGNGQESNDGQELFLPINGR